MLKYTSEICREEPNSREIAGMPCWKASSSRRSVGSALYRSSRRSHNRSVADAPDPRFYTFRSRPSRAAGTPRGCFPNLHWHLPVRPVPLRRGAELLPPSQLPHVPGNKSNPSPFHFIR